MYRNYLPVCPGHIAASMSGVSEGSSDLLCVPNSLQSPDFKYDMEEEPAVSQLTPALLSGRMVECVICTVTKPMTVSLPNYVGIRSCVFLPFLL